MRILEKQAKEIELAKAKELKIKRYCELVSTLRDYNVSEKTLAILTVTQMRVLALGGRIKDASALNRNDLVTNLMLVKSGELEPFESSTKGAPKKAISNFEGINEVLKNFAIKFNKVNNIDYIAKDRVTENLVEDSKDKYKSKDSLNDKARVVDFDTPDDKTMKELGTENICKGILEILPGGYGYLRGSSYFKSNYDIYVPDTLIQTLQMRQGDFVIGKVVVNADSNDYLTYVHSINGQSVAEALKRPKFDELTPTYPNERITLEVEEESDITMRTIDLMCPIGKGQRGLIVAPPKSGKTTIVKKIAKAISTNYKEIKLFVLLIDERPEEVTDMRNTVSAQVVDSTFEMTFEHHICVAELVVERAKRLVEMGQDVVILLDSVTKLSRAYNNVASQSERGMSGFDTQSLMQTKKLFSAARNCGENGSLTIIATALVETGNKIEDLFFDEFKGGANMELILDRQLAERRIFPSINLIKSVTKMDDLIQSDAELKTQYNLRRIIVSKHPVDGAIAFFDMLENSKSNEEFINTVPTLFKSNSNI